VKIRGQNKPIAMAMKGMPEEHYVEGFSKNKIALPTAPVR
jgi:hypothetical protein